MIKKLTEAQEKMIPVYLDKYLKIGLSTEETNKEKAEDAIIRSYKYMNLNTPKIIWADNPLEGAKIALKLKIGDQKPSNDDFSEIVSAASYGSFEAYWISFYSFAFYELGAKKDELIDIVNDIAKNCGVYWTFEDTVIMTPKPKMIKMKNEKLHNTEGYAIDYGNWGVFAINGEVQKNLSDTILKGMMDFE